MPSHSSVLRLFLGLAAVARLAAADICATVQTEVPSIGIAFNPQLDYTTVSNDYWSTSCAALEPSCVIFPSSAQEVSALLAIVSESGESTSNPEPFAVKSGGHNPNNYWSSVQGGPLISTRDLNHVILDSATGIVQFGPGLRWDELAEALDGSGWSVVGGRMGNVGVGGYLLGGGLSFMSQEYGWAASSIIEYELVLANGTIITASASENPDLFKALKGGGNNFGIVTSFTAEAHQQGDVYGGFIQFPRTPEVDRKILKAVHDFTKYNKDDKAALIPTAERAGAGLIDIWVVFIYYNAPQPPAGFFKNFTDIGPTVVSLKTTSMVNLVKSNNWAVLKGSVYTIGTETIPLPRDAAVEVLPAIHEHWRTVAGSVLPLGGLIASAAFQPFPAQIPRLARESGGDLLDFDEDEDMIILELNYSFLLQTDYAEVDVALQRTYGGVRDIVLSLQRNGTIEEAYTPLFANDAFYRQDYFARLKPENAQLAKTLADELDPEGVFRTRTGGWKP
jgi:FAD/FMN-containing dehydrogenase